MNPIIAARLAAGASEPPPLPPPSAVDLEAVPVPMVSQDTASLVNGLTDEIIGEPEPAVNAVPIADVDDELEPRPAANERGRKFALIFLGVAALLSLIRRAAPIEEHPRAGDRDRASRGCTPGTERARAGPDARRSPTTGADARSPRHRCRHRCRHRRSCRRRHRSRATTERRHEQAQAQAAQAQGRAHTRAQARAQAAAQTRAKAKARAKEHAHTRRTRRQAQRRRALHGSQGGLQQREGGRCLQARVRELAEEGQVQDRRVDDAGRVQAQGQDQGQVVAREGVRSATSRAQERVRGDGRVALAIVEAASCRLSDPRLMPSR